MDRSALKEFVLNNPKLVTMRSAGDGIFVLKYSRRVFYDNLWNDFLEECRGTIVDADFNVISRPFTKIYNFRVEAKSPKLDDSTKVTAYRKVNGFMVAVTWYRDDVLVSTTGSTDSPYVAMAKEMMLKHMPWEDWQMEVRAAAGSTLMFECVHPDDPHIVVEVPGMYFLGHRENAWDSQVKMFGEDMAQFAADYARNSLHCFYAESLMTTVGELVAESKRVQHEGFVLYTEDNVSSKIKSPYYLCLKWLARNPRTDKIMSKTADIKQQLDEEYFDLVDAIRENIEEYTALTEQGRLDWIRQYFERVALDQ